MYLNRYCPIILLLLAVICGNVYALQGSTAADGSNAQAVHELGITGAGINIGLISARNVRNTHEAFDDSSGVHVFNSDYSASGVDYTGGSVPGHDTWVAGIIASRGWTGYLNNIGVSPDCNLYSARVVNDSGGILPSYVEDALEALIDTNNCKVIVTAIALDGDADGSSDYSLMYDYFANTRDVVFALASGNNSSNPHIFGDIYNGITTAALIDEPNDFYLRVGSISNPGPTIDGRNKPEISCPGSSQTTTSIGSNTSYYTTVKDGATSFAVPQTGGVAALLLEYADKSPELDDNKNVVIKAAIVNSAFPNIRDKSGNFTDPANRVWDPNRGYGRIDALRAYQTLSSPKVNKGSTVITTVKGWAYDTMTYNNETHTYLIEGNKNERLVLTITWNRAISKSKFGTYSVDLPLFKLDLTVKNPSGDTIYYQAGDANNLEKIDLLLPADGNYTVSLLNTTSKSRAYGLAFELLPSLIGDFNIDYTVDECDLSRIALEWLTAGVEADIIPDDNHIVNWRDFTAFADNWLKIDNRYFTP